jgi:hypothetical protein
VKGGEKDIRSWTLYKKETKTEGLDAQLSTQQEVRRRKKLLVVLAGCVWESVARQSSTVHIIWNRSNKVVRLKDLLSHCNVPKKCQVRIITLHVHTYKSLRNKTHALPERATEEKCC